MTKTKKLLAVFVALLMLIAVMPVSALAQTAGSSLTEASKLAMLQNAWQGIETVEKEALAKKATPAEVTKAAYNAALNEPLIDEGSLVWESEIQFAFTVDGMHCLYYYTARAAQPEVQTGEKDVVSFGTKSNAAGAADVLLVGPYYGVQSSFTDQYKDEANSIAQATGGSRTMLSGSAATGPAIVENYLDKGVVIYDSHGTQSGSSSYLCLTTNTGITSTDYNNGWAVSSGDAAYIDGRYVQNHVTGALSNCMVWMAICEGMKKSGNGTTGTALLAAGAGVVYGYSQSVTFSGDYEYEEHFWTNMKENSMTVAEAFDAMTTELGQWDPAYSSSSGSAWPIVMSADDPFPSNPDSHQIVNCDWTLLGSDPVAIEAFDFADLSGSTIGSVSIAQGKSTGVKISTTPSGANNYTVEWTSSDPAVAAVSSAGNGKSATITGISAGSATVTAVVTSELKTVLTKTLAVTIREADKWNPTDEIVPGEEYLIGFVVNNDVYLAVNYNESGSNHYYYSISGNYYGYTAPAVMSGQSVIGVSGNAADLEYCTWKFETANGGHIYSGYQDGYYLQAYSSVNYADLYPSTNSNYTWTFDAAGHTLYTVVSSTNRYAAYYTDGTNDLMGVFSGVPSNSEIQLFSINAPEPDPTINYYTVTFVDWDGTVLKTQSVKEGGSATAPANPTRPGYVFNGWDPADFSNITADLTVTATYVESDEVWYPVSEIEPGEQYLIGFVVGDNVYLMVNYSATNSNHYYYNISGDYYGYTAPATLKDGNVVGVSGNATDLANCAWKFSDETGGTIQSVYESGRYLYTYSSTSYPDLYPYTSSTAWTYDGDAHTLYATISSGPRYAEYYTNGTVNLMGATSTSTANGYIQLFSQTPEDPSIVYYTVTFKDWDGTVLKTQQVKEGNSATAPAAPYRPGYTFTGWDVDFTNVTSDLVVTAQYVEYTGGYATVILTAGDVWGDGSGYQMLLDADATAYGSIIPTEGGLTSSGNGSEALYNEFEFKIPENADGLLTTSNVVLNSSVTIMIPAGIYDWCITNPTPGDRVWIASANGNIPGRYDDYEFLADHKYVFTVTLNGDSNGDAVNLEITDDNATYYTVTFKDWDGTVLKTEMVEEGHAATAPANPTRPGYTFTGWDVDFSNVTSDLVVTAQYEVYVAPEGFATIILTAGDVWSDGSGYQMLLDANATAYGSIIPENGGLTSSGDASDETYAEFEYKIPENADGSCSTSNIVINNSVSITVPAGIYDWCITNPTPGDRVWIASAAGSIPGRYNDYEFLPDHTYVFTVTLDSSSGNDAVNLEIFDDNDTYYTVTFVDWDGTVLKTQLVVEGAAATPPADPTRLGYTFAGWDVDFSSINADLTVTATYTPKTEYWVPTDTIEAGEEYLIGIVADGVTYLMVNYSDVYNIYYATDDSNNYLGLAAPAYMSGENVLDVSVYATDLLYCTWVFPSGNGGLVQSAFEPNHYLCVYNSTNYSDCYPGTSTSYNWTYDAEAHTLYTVVSDTNRYVQYIEYESLPMFCVTGEVPEGSYIQLFAKNDEPVEPTTYTVTFKDWDGTVIDTQTVVEGEDATEPTAPTREGYTFTGWDVAFTNVHSDLIVTAQYTINSYTITWVIDGVSETQTYNYGETPTHEDPVKEGYTFVGWDPEIVAVTGDATYTAVFEEIVPVGFHIIVTDYTKAKATTSIDAEALYSGEVTFTVTCDNACVVAIDNGDGTYTRLTCTTENGEHKFTVTVTDADVNLVIAIKGDTNLDGNIGTIDSTLIKRALANITPLAGTNVAIKLLAADVNGNGTLQTVDSTLILRSLANLYTIPW